MERNPVRMWLPMVALSLALIAGRSAPASAGCDAVCSLASVAHARACLEYAASFAGEGEARTRILDNDDPWSFTPPNASSNASAVLHLTHESPAALPSRYQSSCVGEIIDYALQTEVIRSPDGPSLLYEASFRKASAHGMFGDDRTLRGLNAAYDPSLPGVLRNPIYDALVKLDSRVCREPFSGGGDPPDTLNGFQALCQNGADCGPGEICAAGRFDDGESGLFGALQEYRLGEQAILESIQALGIGRFREIDLATAASCGGMGCATRLLVRLGALRTRVQAERLEIQWRRAFAMGAVLTLELTCSAGKLDQACQVDRDCDDATPPNGICGTSDKERALVAVQQSAAEALAEASIALGLYGELAPEVMAAGHSDLALLRIELAQIGEAASRSANSLTPFGIPASYVPFLTDQQRIDLHCDETVSVFDCLLFLLTDNTVGVLPELEDAAHQIPLNLAAYSDAIRQQSQSDLLKKQFDDLLERMFGSSCEASGCVCEEAGERAGECFSFDNRTWVLQGVRCDNPNDPFQTCSTSSVDGILELQLQAILNAEVGLENIRLEIERNTDLYSQTIDSAIKQVGIVDDRCSEFQAVIEETGKKISSAFKDRRGSIGANGAGGLADFWRVSGSTAAGAYAGSAGGPPGVVGGGIAGFIGGVSSTLSEKEARAEAEEEAKEQIDLQIDLSEIDSLGRVDINWVQCKSEIRQIIEVNLPDTLFNVESQFITLVGRAREQRGNILAAEISVNQLVAEIAHARQRYDEAVEIDTIWSAEDFRNPQNYRAVALDNQLKAADTLRRAQLVTWLLLRAVAFDLALPDYASPIRDLGPGKVLQLDECFKPECVGDPSRSCMNDGECGSDGPCRPSAEATALADGAGNCSLQAVFAARDAEDLRSLMRSAFRRRSLSNRDKTCDNDTCFKTIRLRDIFNDALADEKVPLGEQLGALPLSRSNVAALDFGISLQRGFNVCPVISGLTRQCQPAGNAGLLDDASGPGDNASDFWNARLVSVQAAVTYRSKRAANAKLCRNPRTGVPVGPDPAGECFLVNESAACPVSTDCADEVNDPQTCVCAPIIASDPYVDLVQVGPGIVRSSHADSINREDRVPRDVQLSFDMRTGDLNPDNNEPELDRFRLSNLRLRSSLEQSVEDESARGIPVASPRWQLQIKPTDLADDNSPLLMREFLTSIEDIQLRFNYEAFNVTE